MPKKPVKKNPKSSSKKMSTPPKTIKPKGHKVKSVTKAKTLRSKKKTKTKSQKRLGTKSISIIPGEVILGEHGIVALAGRPTIELTVANHGDRPIQVGSHCHFFEVNRALRFARDQAFGYRLMIPSGTAARFEPGEEKRVTLIAFGGNRKAYGINGLTNGPLDDPRVKVLALKRAAEQGFLCTGVAS